MATEERVVEVESGVGEGVRVRGGVDGVRRREGKGERG